MTIYIAKQAYPNFRGERPVSFAIYLKREWWRPRQFIGYCWSFGRAYQIAMFLAEQWNKETTGNVNHD